MHLETKRVSWRFRQAFIDKKDKQLILLIEYQRTSI